MDEYSFWAFFFGALFAAIVVSIVVAVYLMPLARARIMRARTYARSQRDKAEIAFAQLGLEYEDDEDEEATPRPKGKAGFLDGLARSAGIDVDRLAAGDPQEFAKLDAAMAQIRPAGGNQMGSKPGSGGPRGRRVIGR